MYQWKYHIFPQNMNMLHTNLDILSRKFPSTMNGSTDWEKIGWIQLLEFFKEYVNLVIADNLQYSIQGYHWNNRCWFQY